VQIRASNWAAKDIDEVDARIISAVGEQGNNLPSPRRNSFSLARSDSLVTLVVVLQRQLKHPSD
jgi:hypothetical protein